ncbi:MAG: hypothetical protein AAF725_00830 [Acidobacteriota bacterium]
MKKLTLIFIALLVVVISRETPPVHAQDAEFVVIVHPDNPSLYLKRSQASLLLLKKKSRWPDWNLQAEPVDLGSDSDVRKALSREIHRKSVSTIKNYWQKQIFSGRNTPPPELKTDSEVVAWVSQRPGAIGYVSASTRLDGVKSIEVDD